MPTEEGIRLDRYLAERGPLQPPQAAKVGIHVAEQLGTSTFPVHPGRILVGRGGAVRLLPPAAEDLALPHLVEYPAYASPEEVRGNEPDLRSALYSIGCTLYELLTGKPPYLRDDPKDLLRAHIDADLPDVRRQSPRVPDSLAETIHELLSKDPDLRIQTTKELVRRLRCALPAASDRQQPPTAATPPVTQPSRRASGSRSPRSPRSERSPRAAASAERAAGDGDGASRRRAAPSKRVARPAAGVRHGQRTGAAEGRRRAPPGGRRRAGVRRGDPPSRRSRLRSEDFDDDAAVAPLRRRRAYPFTLAGTGIGLAIGAVLVVMLLNRQKEIPTQDALRRSQEIAAKTAEARTKRRQEFQTRIARRRVLAEKQLARIREIESPVERKEELVRALDRFCESPAGPALALELARVWSATSDGGAAVDAGFQIHRDEAEELYSNGKLGDAIDRMMRAEPDFKESHGTEIDAFVLKLSEELDERWEADSATVKRLALEGEVDEAIALMEQAVVYGDAPIRRSARQTIEGIRAQALLGDGEDAETSASEEDSEDGVNQDEGSEDEESESTDDLESEFEEFE